MPIEKKSGESKEDFIGRCIAEEINSGMEQDQAAAVCYAKWEEFKSPTQSVTDATWSGEPGVSINLESYNDYPEAAKRNAQIALDWAEENGWGSCGTPVGKQRANQLAKGEPITRETIARMAAFERHRQNSQKDLGDGCGRLMWQAWGGDEGIEWAQRKLEQIDREDLQKFSKVRRVLFNEDFNEDDVLTYKNLGFKVLVRSKRKYKKKDKKVWNKLSSVGLTEDNLVFGEVKDLHKKYDFELLMTGQDPHLEKLSLVGQEYKNKQVIKSKVITNLQEALDFEKEPHNLKFITVRTLYYYRERPDVQPAQSGSRPFCSRLMETPQQGRTLDEIMSLGTKHLTDMGLPADPFLYRGGFYTTPGGQRGPDTTPFCRHEWVAELTIVR